MTDPAEFLKAALDAAEATANAAAEIWLGPDGVQRKPERFVYGDSAAVIAGENWTHTDDMVCNADDDVDNATHIAANDPAHVLRMVTAHRKLLGLHEGEHECPSGPETYRAYVLDGESCDTVKFLAEAYGWTPA